MELLAFLDQIRGWWDELNTAKQLFYAIGLLAGLVSLVLAVLAMFGIDQADAADAADIGDGGIFSVKPLTGFFLGFGWAGGIALDSGLSFPAALAIAFGAGGSIMAVVLLMIRTIYGLKSDGTVQVRRAVGAVGTVYVTVPARRASGGQVVVSFDGRQETLAAVSSVANPIPSGEKVRVTSIIDGRTVEVEPL